MPRGLKWQFLLFLRMWNSGGFIREVLLMLSTQICYLPNRGLKLKLIFSGTVYSYSNLKGVNYLEKCNNKDHLYLMNC